ncbi:RHS repeat-associated core domain-containing protein [Chryseobacterium gotjawalense]|uniref:RHS repeat-associated core domain-containing protein n=1 Tax=Chryseobacterium gotjawalense TaxID=3042315 RepID=A0ABY8RD98_9FLAO|nr:RHS repeat-associated core domain-containing protein [Chryseobacterium sp. wdc7]WHF51960.1 RHS repeat-associated core domain-containing protein [Chryseobacterium sp. wdc7]
MKKFYLLITILVFNFVFSQNTSFHDTQGNIEVNGGGQLQYTLPIALPPGIKSVGPQVNLIYTSGGGNGIAGYGWNLSGITSITRMGKTIEKDGEVAGIKLDYSDYYSFNGQRLIYKSGGNGPGQDGANGSFYTTEKYSNIKVKAIGSITGQEWKGPEYWEVTFEDGSQAWYGNTTTGSNNATTPVEYNIVKWKDAQGNYISYNYNKINNVATISDIQWGGNEAISGKTHFNKIQFNYSSRNLLEVSYVKGVQFTQDRLLQNIVVSTNGSQFKKYHIEYDSTVNVDDDPNKIIGYQFVKSIKEFNSNNEEANPVSFSTKPLTTNIQEKPFGDFQNVITSGDYNGDGLVDFIVKQAAQNGKPEGYYIYFDAVNNVSPSYVYLGVSSNFQYYRLLTFNIKSADNYVKTKQGLILIKSLDTDYHTTPNIELIYYSVNSDSSVLNTTNNPLVVEYTKTIVDSKYKFVDSYYPPYSTPANYGISNYSSLELAKEADINSDGISELIFAIKDSRCFKSQIAPNNWSCNDLGFRYAIVDNDTLQDDTLALLNNPTTKNILSKGSIMDFDNDGGQDIMFIERDPYNTNTNVSFATKNRYTGNIVNQTVSTPLNRIYQYSLRRIYKGFYSLYLKDTYFVKGLTGAIQFADLNGDRNIEILAPLTKITSFSGADADNVTGWSIYLNNGSGLSEFCQGFQEYYENENPTNSYQQYSYPGVTDIDNDGKSEFFNFYAGYNMQGNGFSNTSLWKLSEFRYNSNNSQFKWTYKSENVFSNGKGGTSMSPIYGDFRINGSNSKILFISKSLTDANDRKIISYHSYNLGVNKNISTITQGGITTNIEYKELDPEVNPNLYAPLKKEQYPYMEMDKVSQSYAVSRLTQEGRTQDFRYRGLITHLQGRGMIGFRQTARSTWYADGMENTKIWSGAEIDPLNEGLPIKEWSIKPISVTPELQELEIFPENISVDTPNLLNYKQTTYQTDIITGLAYKAIKVIVPIQNTTKDFLKDIATTNTITYDNYYLPKQTISKVNNDFAISTTNLEYLNNSTGTGKDYFIGRPLSKTVSMTVYGDTKGSKEEYSYNSNNLLEYLTKYDQNYAQNTAGWIKEKYTYDEGNTAGFGNITKKEITNSVDLNAIIVTTKAEYEAKGRFVTKTTDNLGLEENITYNDWGQVLTKTDPLNNNITNTYDSWGKLQTSSTNIGGTASYQYESFTLAGKVGKKVTEISPDGNLKVSFTNNLGQNYKVLTKAFEQNKYVAKETRYDGLGRKTYESEPYFSTISPNYGGLSGNTISYDDTVFPTKVTVQTANSGKKIETSISGRTTTIVEKNGYGRTYIKATDAIGNLILSTDPGGTITYTYNAAGQQTKAQYAENAVTTSYDEWGRKSEFYDPANGKYEYKYTNFGEIKEETSRKGYKQYLYKPNGLLDQIIEKSKDGTSTDKSYNFSYDPNTKQLTLKSGTANGKTYVTSYSYRPDGRLGWTTEYIAGKEFFKQNIVYDQYGRVSRYDQGLVSSGVTTTVAIQNIYNTWDGSLYQLKQESTNKILWELQTTNAKGQALTAKLGAAQITNTYSPSGFISTAKHTSPLSSIVDNYYMFDAVKNELVVRYSYIFGINETFTYDNNNRLINWTNPKTGQQSSNTYDDKGRITVNDQLGNIGYTIGGNIYRASNINLNANGLANYGIDGTNILLQNITYNENNDPIKIRGRQNDYAFEYGLSESRQIMSYGGKFEDSQNAKFTKYYSEDGSMEIIKNNQTQEEKHILYIGGSPYESNIVYFRYRHQDTGSFYFLHKDYLGSILAVADKSGYVIEQRHYDAWGNFTNLKIVGSNQNPDTYSDKLLVSRGYTSHEHLAGVGLIHMNGRLYDPLLRRFLNADENIQDPTNTQNYNKYGYVMNNPLMYNDPSGEFFVAGFFLTYIAPIIWGAIVGAGIGAAMYVVQGLFTNNWSLGGFAKSVLLGAITGGVSGGIANIFQAAGFWGTVGVGSLSGGATGGITSIMSGQNFFEGLLKGAVIGGAVGAVSYGLGKLFSNPNGNQAISEIKRDDLISSNSVASGDSQKYSYGTIKEFEKGFGSLGNSGVEKYYLQAPSGYSVAQDSSFYKMTWLQKNFGYGGIPEHSNVLGVTVGKNIYLSKAAFATKSLLTETITHEVGHVILNNSTEFILANTASNITGKFSQSLDTWGHVAIRKMTSSLSNLNPWFTRMNIPTYFFLNSKSQLDKLLLPLIKSFNY